MKMKMWNKRVTQTALVLLALSFPVSVFASEVRRLSIRGLRVEKTGDLTLFISMRDSQNNPVTQWDSSLLSIEIDGKPLTDLTATAQPFAKSGEGRAVLLAFDVSGSMASAMTQVLESSTQYLQSIRPSIDKVAIGKIGSEWSLVQDFSADQNLLRDKIKSLKANDFGTTALFESLDLGIEHLRLPSHSDLPSRRSLVVVTDGLNEKSGRTANECIAKARSALVQVHSLIFQAKPTAKLLAAKGEVEKISRDSDGFTSSYSSSTDFSKYFFQLNSDLDSELVVSLKANAIPKETQSEHSLVFRYQQASDSTKFSTLTRGKNNLICDRIPSTGDCNDTGQSERELDEKARLEEKANKDRNKLRSGNYLLVAVGGLLFLAGLGLVIKKRQQIRSVNLQAQSDQPDANIQRNTESLGQEHPAYIDAKDTVSSPILAAKENESAAARSRKTEYRAPVETHAEQLALRVIEGECQGFYAIIPVKSGCIGRNSENDIAISSDSVSGHHADFNANASGQIIIKDHNSTNGTFLNGQRVSGWSQPLQIGDRIRFGMVSITVEKA